MSDSVITGICTAIVAIIGTLFGVNFWKSRQKSSDNNTKIRLKQMELDSNGNSHIIKQNDELKKQVGGLQQEVHQLTIRLEKSLTGLKVLMLMLKDEFQGKPHIIQSIEEVMADIAPQS